MSNTKHHQNNSNTSPLEAILQLAQNLGGPFQAVFKLRNTTQTAKNRVKELRHRVERLEAEIDAAKGKSGIGSKLDRLR